MTKLKTSPCQFQPLKLHLGKGIERRPLIVLNAARSPVVGAELSGVRFRLDNLGPQPGSRKKAKRKGRGISAGQGNSCGFGMRGQKSRSGPGVRRGFEGGQMPLYRRIPKLKGIAGGKIGCYFWVLMIGFVCLIGGLCWVLDRILNLVALCW